ncbi:mitochondrial nicotinamide adenine dinucleotide transporter SLC25A51 [Cylas formicarius]|uniref:mitochondrial nicotinamide adenine dinucleotide transporter SLC25A51 n=1 Tax=Cylas formicarius TaxID=197179 RepID=UPI0029584DB1|nr:mitochondrial nicotinamide adenine dinucleotide transporter SLC25A51 [Cylas formicarius]
MSSLAEKPTLNWKEFVCGWGAAFINVTVTYPINKIIFRQMLHGIKAKKAFYQLHGEGIFFLYRGILPPLCQKTLSLSIMFGVYEQVRQPLVETGVNRYMAKALGALISGTTEAALMPFERVQTLLQNAHYHDEFKNTFHAFKALRSYGLVEYYRGLVPILLRNGPSNIGFFIAREELQNCMPKYDNEFIRTSTEFMCGALIGVVLSSIFYPLNVLKVAMQNKIGGEFENPVKVFVQIYRDRGCKVRYFYHGVQMNCARAFISWGVMNTAYEHIKAVIY